MNLAKAESFFKSLDRLTKTERYAVLDAVYSLEKGEVESSGLHDEPLHGRSSDFRSIRADGELRVIYHPCSAVEGVLCFAGHHEQAYTWAETHKCRENPVTRVVQVYQDVVSAPAASVAASTTFPPAGDRPYPFRDWPSDGDLALLGIPDEQRAFVRGIMNEDDLIAKGDQMPPSAWDKLVDLVGEPTKLPELLEAARASAAAIAPGSSLTAQRAADPAGMSGFSFVSGDEELNRMRDGSLDAWRVFLHPEQRKVVERHFAGPVKVTGGAGTGKTVVALHRVKWLLENAFTEPSQKILLTTFTRTLAGDLAKLLSSICTSEQMSRVTVQTLDQAAHDLLAANGVRARIDYTTEKDVSRKFMTPAMSAVGYSGKYKVGFFLDEYESVVEAEGLKTEEEYLAASRRGRSVSVTADDRRKFWPVFEKFRELFVRSGQTRRGEAINRAIALLKDGAVSPYVSVVVDEVQDLDAVALRFVAALSGNSANVSVPDSLVLVGDAHQRIYGKRVSLAQCGIQTKGRSKSLKMNYRSTQKIRLRAEAVLAGVDVDDLDESVVSFRGGRSLVLGETPDEERFENPSAMFEHIKQAIGKWKAGDNARAGAGPQKTWADYAVLVSTNNDAATVAASLQEKWLPSVVVSGNSKAVVEDDRVRIMTMHRAKGLEFAGVFIVLNADKWPVKPTGYTSMTPAERHAVVVQSKSLLYVAMTRAISHLGLTGVGPAPEEL